MTITLLKKTGTYSDVLIAVGIADLITEILEANDIRSQPIIKDGGNIYTIEVSVELTEELIENWEPSPGYEYVKFKDSDPIAPRSYFDYEKQREIEKAYREFQRSIEGNAKKKEKVLAELRERGEGVSEPDPMLSLYKTLNGMRMGSNKFGEMYVAISEAEADFKKLLSRKLGLVSGDKKQEQQPNEKPYEKAASTLQLFNPVSGKGINRAKPDGTTPASFPVKLTDWFEEWMKFRAFTKVMLTYPGGSEGKDTKVLVIAPQEIGTRVLKVIHSDILTKRFYGSIFLDIMMTLSLAKSIVLNSEEFKGQPTGIRLLFRTPKDIIAGFYQTYFKSLGTASAVMNVSFLGMPNWFKVKDRADVEVWLEIVEEHERCLKSLNESHSDDVPILLAYRTFLSTSDVMDALDFFALYASHYMRRKAQNEWAEPFTTENLGRLFMKDVIIQDIIQDEGFKNIASAIRKSTVSLQLMKGMGKKPDYEIQYGLAQDWKRKVHNKVDFIMEISEFVQKYNAENARRAEQKIKPRKNVTEEDLNRVISLIEKTNNSKLVGLLLLAYGYAKSPKEESDLQTSQKEEVVE